MTASRMKTRETLRKLLSEIDGRGYKGYKKLKGSYDFEDFCLTIDHVQSDPFAGPSRFRVTVNRDKAGFPPDTLKNKSRETGLRDFLTRKFFSRTREFSKSGRGTGKSGLITMDFPGQEILERTSVLVRSDVVEARFFAGLPARGRSVLAKVAEKMIFDEIPRIVRNSLFYKQLNADALYKHIETAEDADYLRGVLPDFSLIAFVADGAVLPRASGVDDRPLEKGNIVAFASPADLRVSLDLPNRGPVTGTGIRKGVTLIAGGGYHGKSTLLDAVKLGIYNHVPGDGRELVVTTPDAVMIRAEDGRRIEQVDISPFISNLPFMQDTTRFCSENASGSTSQAANIMEALEAGSGAILIDEDTSATNFMIRDHRMQELVSKDQEPITPFIDKVRHLYEHHGVSTILVIGGSGDYFDVADCVITMKEYVPEECTGRAKEIARRYVTERKREGGDTFGDFRIRIPLAKSFDPSRGKKDVKISSKGLRSIVYGIHDIDLGSIEQLVDMSQTRALGDAIHYATKYMDGQRTSGEVIEKVMDDIRNSGLDVLSGMRPGDYAMFRKYELAAAINRLRTLTVLQKE